MPTPTSARSVLVSDFFFRTWRTAREFVSLFTTRSRLSFLASVIVVERDGASDLPFAQAAPGTHSASATSAATYDFIPRSPFAGSPPRLTEAVRHLYAPSVTAVLVDAAGGIAYR